MNIIEKVREILQNFPKIQEVCNTVHIDFADPDPTSYGLSSIGESVISEDILGNLKKRHSFLLYAVFSSINDYERIANTSVLIELSDWLRNQSGEIETAVDGKVYKGEIIEIKAGNGMLYDVPQENRSEGVRYQLQINADYTVNYGGIT